MVGHEGVGVERAAFLLQGLAQPVEVDLVILFAKEARLAIMPALHDVQGNAIEMDAGAAGHERNLQRAMK